MKNKGFTLIELLVVVSIIGVLATIVLASLGSARNRAQDAKIKTTLSQMRTQAELQFLDTGDYTTVCDSGTVSFQMFEDAHSIGGQSVLPNLCADENNVPNGRSGGTLNNNTHSSQWFGEGWVVSVKLNTDDIWFCVDSLGNAIEREGRILEDENKECE